MGLLKYLKRNVPDRKDTIPKPLYPKNERPDFVLEPDIVNISIASSNPVTKRYIVHHDLSDYRRRDSGIILLPEVVTDYTSFLSYINEIEEDI